MGWRRKQKNRTENGPSWENANPGAGCNSTHVARARKWWQKFANRTERRTGKTSAKFHSMSNAGKRPQVRPDYESLDDSV